MKTILKVFTLLIVAAVSGCDDSDDHLYSPFFLKDSTIYSTKGSTVLINSRACFNSVYQEDATFRIVRNPSFGKVRVMSYGDYFYYEPNLPESKNEDMFVVEMVSAQGKKTQLALRISTVEGCQRGPLVTYVKIKNNELFSLNLLNNDLFCNLNVKSFAFLSRQTRNVGGDCSVNSFTFNYTPHVGQFPWISGDNFPWITEFIYEVGLNPNSEISEWAPNYEWYFHPEIFERYASVRLVVEVVE